jgi:hypothetical protein
VIIGACCSDKIFFATLVLLVTAVSRPTLHSVELVEIEEIADRLEMLYLCLQVLHVFSIACPIFRLFRFLRRIFNTFPISVFQSALFGYLVSIFPRKLHNFQFSSEIPPQIFCFFMKAEDSHFVIFNR